MPDITMCVNDACPLASQCWRHEAEPTPGHQSWAMFKPTTVTMRDGPKTICNMQLPMRQKKVDQPVDRTGGPGYTSGP